MQTYLHALPHVSPVCGSFVLHTRPILFIIFIIFIIGQEQTLHWWVVVAANYFLSSATRETLSDAVPSNAIVVPRRMVSKLPLNYCIYYLLWLHTNLAFSPAKSATNMGSWSYDFETLRATIIQDHEHYKNGKILPKCTRDYPMRQWGNKVQPIINEKVQDKESWLHNPSYRT